MGILQFWPVIAFMVVQTVTIAWWASKIHEKVRRLEEDMEGHEGLTERFGKMEVKLDTILSVLSKGGKR